MGVHVDEPVISQLTLKEWMHVCFGSDDIDQRDLLFQSIARFERTAGKAEESDQFAVVVGCIAQLNKMMALGSD